MGIIEKDEKVSSGGGEDDISTVRFMNVVGIDAESLASKLSLIDIFFFFFFYYRE